jgi:hypothetical protein
MKFRHLVVGAAVAVAALGTTAAPAFASAPPHPQPAVKSTFAKVVGVVTRDRKDHTAAWVYAVYRCTVKDPVGDPGHLWVSVKQNDRGTVDSSISAEGSGWGGTATRWEDSHRNPIRCDGRIHLDRFKVDQIEDKGTYKPLTWGKAWVQFCLFDDTTPKGDGETDFGQPVSDMSWKWVF